VYSNEKQSGQLKKQFSFKTVVCPFEVKIKMVAIERNTLNTLPLFWSGFTFSQLIMDMFVTMHDIVKDLVKKQAKGNTIKERS